MGSFAQRLRDAMQSAGLKAVDLHERTGISKASISEYLSGNYEPKQKNVYRLAKALHVAPSYLMGLSEPDPAPAPPAPQKSDGLPERQGSYYHDPVGAPLPEQVRIPIVGRIVAGEPEDAYQEPEGYVMIDKSLAQHGRFYALRVHGDSMEPTIFDGDIVVYELTPDIDDGRIHIVLVDGGEATVKEVHRQQNGLTLIGHNPKVYPPHFYTAEECAKLPVRIIGRVRQLVRNM